MTRALVIIAMFAMAFIGGAVWLANRATLAPSTHARDALTAAMLGYWMIHGAIAAIATALQAWRVQRGLANRLYEPLIVLQWWRYTVATYWIGAFALGLIPLLWPR